MKLWELLLLKHILEESNEAQPTDSNPSMLYILVNLVLLYIVLLVLIALLMFQFGGQFSNTIFWIYNIIYMVFSFLIIILKILSWIVQK